MVRGIFEIKTELFPYELFTFTICFGIVHEDLIINCYTARGSAYDKEAAIVLVVLMLAIVAWGLFLERNAVTLIINGQQVTGPMKGAIGAAGLVVALIALFCAAILLVFVLAGIGVLVLGCFVFVGMILALLAFPFLLPLLVPLVILWIFVAVTRRENRSK